MSTTVTVEFPDDAESVSFIRCSDDGRKFYVMVSRLQPYPGKGAIPSLSQSSDVTEAHFTMHSDGTVRQHKPIVSKSATNRDGTGVGNEIKRLRRIRLGSEQITPYYPPCEL